MVWHSEVIPEELYGSNLHEESVSFYFQVFLLETVRFAAFWSCRVARSRFWWEFRGRRSHWVTETSILCRQSLLLCISESGSGEHQFLRGALGRHPAWNLVDSGSVFLRGRSGCMRQAGIRLVGWEHLRLQDSAWTLQDLRETAYPHAVSMYIL